MKQRSKSGLLKNFPWATLGRREVEAEFFKKLDEQRGRVALLANKPKISVVLIIPDSLEVAYARQALEALRLQSYPFWEAFAISSKKLKEKLEEIDDRIRFLVPSNETSEAAWKNFGASHCTGDWIRFIDAEDILSPAAFFHLIYSLQGHGFGMVYTNEVLLARKSHAFLSKGEWSWFNLIHFNSVGRFWMVQRSLFERLGKFRSDAGDYHEHEFFLRLEECGVPVLHEPYFFYYRRKKTKTSPPRETLVPWVQAHLKKKGFAAKVVTGNQRDTVRVIPHISEPKQHLVTAVLCYRDKPEWTIQAAQRFARQVGQVPVELVLVNNQSSAESVRAVTSAAAKLPIPTRCIDYSHPFNFGNMHNWVLENCAKGDLLFLLNNDVFLKGDRNLDEMIGWALQPQVGTVGILLRFPDGSIQHGGFRALFGGDARLVRIGHVAGSDPWALENREVFGNTFAAALIKISTVKAQSGFREIDLPNGFGDVAFNFTCVRQGLKNLYLGHIEAVHLESASRGSSYEYWEEVGIEREFPEVLQKMLRQDFGLNRVPGADFPLKAVLRLALTHRIGESLPWLLPLKPVVKKLFRKPLKPILE